MLPAFGFCSQLYINAWLVFRYVFVLILFPFIVNRSPLLNITSGSSWLYVEWNAQSATFRVLYRESGAPDYQVIVPRTSQLSHNISALQPNTLYNIVVEATHTLTQEKVNSSVTRAYTTPHGECKAIWTDVVLIKIGSMVAMTKFTFFCACITTEINLCKLSIHFFDCMVRWYVHNYKCGNYVSGVFLQHYQPQQMYLSKWCLQSPSRSPGDLHQLLPVLVWHTTSMCPQPRTKQ